MLGKSEIINLRDRWSKDQTAAGQAVLEEGGEPPFPSSASGSVDLRGMAITAFIKGVKLESVDFSGASLEGFGQFGMCEVSTCRFTSATLTTNLGSKFTECDFTSARLTGAVLRGRFVDCDFSLARLSSAMGNEVSFVRCTFDGTDFRKSTLLHCRFEACEFKDCRFGGGSFAFTKFVNSPISIEELGDTIMEGVDLG